MTQRERWASRPAFIMAAIGSAIGLGNVWRFPYVAYSNGGGAFLIPYFVALFTAGIPLLVLEFGLGQMMQGSSPKSLAKIHRKWEWVGWWALMVGSMIAFYYCVVLGYCWNYLYHSFTLAWGQTPAEARDFFFNQFLQITGDPGTIGGIRWPILIGLALAWMANYWVIVNGVKRIGQVVMWMVPVPIIFLIILFVRAMTLPGAMDGIAYYLTPDFSQLLNGRVWLAAYSQIFFSLSLGFGILMAYASHLPRDAEITNNAFITALANCGFSFFAGFVVFSTLGFLAHATGAPVESVIDKGPGLAFVIYPAAISQLPFWSQLFGVLFFVTLLFLGIDSAFSIVEAIVTGLNDKWDIPRPLITKAFCLLGFLAGIPFCTRAGLYWLDIVDNWMSNFGLAAVGFAECVIVGWMWNTRKLTHHLDKVSEIPAGHGWEFCVRVITPAVLGITLVMSLIEEFKRPYENYPIWALFMGGWCVTVAVAIFGMLVARIKPVKTFVDNPEDNVS
ncbi:MAG: sodium-dependent transporter [Candidatus Omnitrophica bacterium]|nr:sodium-dependent transporter [Candidatus Omnitrophota bacterium]